MTKSIKNFANPEASSDEDPPISKSKTNRGTPSDAKHDQSEDMELVKKPNKSNSFKEWKTYTQT